MGRICLLMGELCLRENGDLAHRVRRGFSINEV